MDVKNLWQIYVDTIIKLVPKPPLPAAIGIDIGTSNIKLIELARCSGGFELRNFKIEPFESATVSAVLKKLIDGVGLSNQTLVVAVSGKGTLIRYVDVPKMSNDDLRKSLAYELDKYFPFDPSSIYYDCHIIDENLPDKKMAALVTAVKKDLVDERLRIFKQAGQELNKITTNAIATANAFGELAQPNEAASHAKGLLDIGGSLSNLMIIQNRSPRFTRDIYIGANDLTRQIANVLGVDAASAEALKISGERGEEVLNACEDTIANLVGEVRLSLDYFITERNINVDELFVVGGGAKMNGLTAVLEKHLGIPVKVWQPLAGLKLSTTVAQTDIFNHAPQLGVALGLALSGL